MKKSIFLVTHVHEAGIQAWHQFLDASQIHVAHRKGDVSSFALEFHQLLVFKQCNGYLFGLYVYNEFACHNYLLLHLLYRNFLFGLTDASIFCILVIGLILKQRTNPRDNYLHKFVLYFVLQTKNYFLLLCLFFLSLFLRLCVDILCLFFFFPLGIASKFYGLILLFIIFSQQW